MTLRPGLLLDVDGTLIDSNYFHTLAWSRAFMDLGEWAPANAIHRLVGMGGDQLVPELFGRDIEGASSAWRYHYEALMEEVRVFPGATALIRGAADAGLAVVIASSAPAKHVEVSRKLLGCDDVIVAATTSDDVADSKPDPAIFTEALRRGGARCAAAYQPDRTAPPRLNLRC